MWQKTTRNLELIANASKTRFLVINNIVNRSINSKERSCTKVISKQIFLIHMVKLVLQLIRLSSKQKGSQLDNIVDINNDNTPPNTVNKNSLACTFIYVTMIITKL